MKFKYLNSVQTLLVARSNKACSLNEIQIFELCSNSFKQTHLKKQTYYWNKNIKSLTKKVYLLNLYIRDVQIKNYVQK
jgi:hypothetical protein